MSGVEDRLGVGSSVDPLLHLGLPELVLLLRSVPHVGEKSLAAVLHQIAADGLDPQAFLNLQALDLRRRYRLDSRAVTALFSQRSSLVERSLAEGRMLRARGVHTLTLWSASYPARLIRFEGSPPPVLYARGALELLAECGAGGAARFTFALALSNGSSLRALGMAQEIGARLVALGGVPCTGHDRAAYQYAALAAQRQGRPTVYVLDRGLRESMGAEFDRPLFAAARIRDLLFDAQRDLALSPFRLDDHSLGSNNRRRDGLIFSLADLIVAVDVRPEGSMLACCLRARELGKPVWVCADGREGCRMLLQEGCTAVPEEWEAAIRTIADSRDAAPAAGSAHD